MRNDKGSPDFLKSKSIIQIDSQDRIKILDEGEQIVFD